MKLVFKIVGLTIGLFVIFIFGVVFFSLQSTPTMINKHVVDVVAASESKVAAKRLIDSLNSKEQPVIVSLSQLEINGLSALSNRAIPQLTVDVVIEHNTAKLDAVLELSLPKPFKYLNISGLLLPNKEGLHLDDISVGGLSISGKRFLSLVQWSINTFVENDLGTKVTKMVKWVKIFDDKVEASVVIPQNLNDLEDKKSGFVTLREKLSLFGGKIDDPMRVASYYSQLTQQIDVLNVHYKERLSISYYINLMFTIVEQQKENDLIDSKQSSAIQENSAAFMALAVYFGSDSFELMIGDIKPLNRKQRLHRKLLRRVVTLNNRVDLQKHFIYSVAFQLFSNTTTSDTIGELKELLDSNGGSGFSFADLMADRAGTRLAQLVTSNEKTARKVQLLLNKNIKESGFMPTVIGLPEGISAKKFETQYVNAHSVNYQKMLTFIDNQLALLPLYQ